MKKSVLFALWGGLFAVCACLGFIPEPEGAMKGLLTAVSVAFFLPAFALIRLSAKNGDVHTLALLRNLAALSLILTMVLLIANFLTVTASETLGNILYYMLIIITSPMVCSQYWVLSLFLWACLMITCAKELKKK